MSNGVWEQHAAERWVYRIPGRTRPAGYAVREEPNGDLRPHWEAVVASRPVSMAVVARDVSLRQARAIIEQEVSPRA